jgi:putative transposase
VGLAFAVVERLAFGVAHCQAGDRHRLASPGISPLLEMEESALQWSSIFISGSSESNSSNEPRQPALGAPRIHGELLKIGIDVSQATVAKYMARHRKPPSQSWRTFLRNHAKDLVSIDFFVVPTITFQLLFAFVILGHDRRRPVHFAVTSNPTAEWTARQLLQAFPWDNATRYLLRDRDAIYGEKFCETARWMGIHEVLTAPQSPWQNPYVERLIGSIRRECLDHVIVFHEAGLRRILRDYFAYYERCRTHLSLGKDAPVSRPVEPPSLGHVIEIQKVGGLHHLYTRKAA